MAEAATAPPELLQARSRAKVLLNVYSRIELDVIIAHILRQHGSSSRCSSCKAQIVWIEYISGNRAPFDPDGDSHFATCPNASAHRTRKDLDG